MPIRSCEYSISEATKNNPENAEAGQDSRSERLMPQASTPSRITETRESSRPASLKPNPSRGAVPTRWNQMGG